MSNPNNVIDARPFGPLSATRIIPVSWGDCDAAAIVFYARYYAWFDASTHAMLEGVGLDHHTLQNDFGVVGLPLVTASAVFKAPVTYGEQLEARCVVSEVGRSRITLEHTMMRDGVCVVHGSETRVWARQEARSPRRLVSEPIPPAVRRVLLGEVRATA